MKKTFSTALTLAAAGVLLFNTPRVSAQDAPPPPPPGAPAAGGPGAGGAGGDRMEQFRQRMAERIKTQLKATDDEWSVIQPLLTEVETKQRATMTNRFGGMMGGGGPGGPGGGGGRRRNGGQGGGGTQADAATTGQPAGGPGGAGGGAWQGRGGGGGSPESQALSDTLKNDNASVDEIKAKLAAVRVSRKKAETELTQARENLKKVLNMRQEATLVAMGVLE